MLDVSVVGAVRHTDDRVEMVVGCIVPQGILYTPARCGLETGRGAVAHGLERLEAVPGTKTSLISNVLEPVPLSPTTYQSSMICSRVIGSGSCEVDGTAVLDQPGRRRTSRWRDHIRTTSATAPLTM